MPVPARPLNRLLACRSRPHRAILGLMAPALGYPVPGTLAQDLRASSPGELVKIATYAYVHTVIASAFENAPELAQAVPRDLCIYFAEMQKANRRRNDAIRAQLLQIGEILAARGIEAVALKGCAGLLQPVYPAPGMRFLSDIDLLLQDRDIGAACAALEAAGAAPSTTRGVTGRGHHHLPPLTCTGWAVSVELHHALGGAKVARLLPAGEVFAASQPGGRPGLRLPGPLHRVMHLAAHAELSKRPLEAPLLALRDCLELRQMQAALPAGTVAAARGRFAAAGCGKAFGRLAEAAAAVLEPAAAPETGAGLRCGNRMLRLFGRPAEQKLRKLAGWTGFYIGQFVSNPQLRSYYLRMLASPEALARVSGFHRKWLQRF
ncbi:nucleotidyltransferase family protein [Cribrihabitans neustonicus]|uniref:nucleotidyltransferase family protein n=1 Tax=Cribrihabitans neustonicus TaxID=1429085 RepID=UPI003B5BBE85